MRTKSVPLIQIARNQLEQWGKWWRGQETGEAANTSGTSPMSALMEVMILGTRVQKTNTRAHHQLAESIRPPERVVEVDRIIAGLPRSQQQALTLWYVRYDHRKPRSDADRPKDLLWAEMAVGEVLTKDHVDQWAVPYAPKRKQSTD